MSSRVGDKELCSQIEQSAFHVGLEASKTKQIQDDYRVAIRAHLLPRIIDLVQSVSATVGTDNYRQSIIKARKLVALMERISRD